MLSSIETAKRLGLSCDWADAEIGIFGKLVFFFSFSEAFVVCVCRAAGLFFPDRPGPG
jgi:hypothetical protein